MESRENNDLYEACAPALRRVQELREGVAGRMRDQRRVVAEKKEQYEAAVAEYDRLAGVLVQSTVRYFN